MRAPAVGHICRRERRLRGSHLDASNARSWPYAARRTASAAQRSRPSGNLGYCAPGSAGNEARDADFPRRL